MIQKSTSLKYEPSSEPQGALLNQLTTEGINLLHLLVLQVSSLTPTPSGGTDITPFRMTGVTLHSHVRCKERSARPPHRQPKRVRVMQPGGVPREQNMLKGHLPRVIYHGVY